MEQLVRGVPDETGLIYKLRGPQHKFQRAIRQTAPDFRPLERREAGDTTRVPSPSFYSCEESELDQEPSDTSQPIFVDDVMKRVNRYVRICSYGAPQALNPCLPVQGLASYRIIMSHILS